MSDTIEQDGHGHVDVDTVQLSAELVEAASVASHDVAEYALWLGDDSLVLAQNLGWWISRAPELEEDIALGNIALDLIGHARSLLHYAGAESGRTEDDLAYWRDEPQWRSAHLFEQPNGDFAHTIARQFIAAHYLFELYSALMQSTDATLAAIAAKAVKEVDYHRDHSIQWVLRLAQGTEESRRRMITGLSDLWPFVEELFVDEPLIDRLEGVAVRPSSLQASVLSAMFPVLAEAELEVPRGFISSGGGRRGDHSENLGPLLAEMQVLARAHPGAKW
ncbi:phenylacetate-CoA oxygenase subunit PaaI [Cryobacterium sp. TMT1-62]|uniref:Phenylacetate-CoA oxygenase subunit PaaI n=1 Tax=Cryobacterium sandaracinum TaxID=1259247 RepID=A0ABY2JG05_9MICO|nr:MULTISPECIES: 1,2-phenylacetyl-CoA epoxidase subunit PaaC [Cryobacterium]TFB55141.1 phenylacetate-CoA oxygenase subunit PaaI [Cryobacterium sp. Sr3]TFB63601.1 phenylacetate-CoA oxygenase subunit PaaI [Cryobacterium sp. Hz7]TFC52411.1 phenylacetate-CoA oxygenase subunit PaaI [Cryobacterium sp. TMT2-17-1]TFD04918.1 phenylacetate-CoA oxygenase subunit PaaI [Cryobacterium sandaracinum]TFD36558.1 phenylacetate-CoA oxygenase subunit PaaI [Cryobacterium sp. TMT1-62]